MREIIKLRYVVIILMLTMVVGCATMNTVKPMPADVDAKIKKMQPPSGKSIVYVVRPTIIGKPFGGNITANDEFIGITQGGMYVYAILSPGEYKFKVTGHDNDSEIIVKIEADKIYYIHQGVYPGIFKGTTSLKLLNKDEGIKDLQECTLGDKLGKNIVF